MKFAHVLRLCLILSLGASLWLGAPVPAEPASWRDASVAPWPDDLKSEVAALVGVWEGKWDAVLPSRLIVEKIDAEWASIVYAWADDPQGRFGRGWTRLQARVGTDGTLRWGYPGLFTFEISEDYAALVGHTPREGRTAEVIMHRVETIGSSFGTSVNTFAELPLPLLGE